MYATIEYAVVAKCSVSCPVILFVPILFIYIVAVVQA